ncbi:MAG: DUF1848 domain-containing protein [Bacteroidales bacterium]|nr:DUF1848 domain-containing protein [Bacteroidales bacterium]
MAQWQKIQIQRENGETVDAQAPLVISASRGTDIPAFYADWFFNRLKAKYSAWKNPFSGQYSYVSYQNARFFVFWSKNPKSLLDHTDELKKMNFYIQFTLNDYVSESLEKGVPPLEERIETFKQLVETFGKGRVIWRFDPLILTDKITVDDLLRKVENIGDQLKNYTEKLVFSFADIALYKKVKSNLEKNNINYSEWTENQMIDFAKRLSILNQKWNFQLATCGEKIDIAKYGIQHNKCVDDDLMIMLAYKDKMLMDFLKVEIQEKDLFDNIPQNAIILNDRQYAIKKKDNKDGGQRQFCGCIVSKDIGEYDTCPHLCEYCYANTSKATAVRNYNLAKQTNWTKETITGK